MVGKRISRIIGLTITNIFGNKIAYYCKYPLDRKAMIRALKKGIKKDGEGKQIQESSKIAIIFIGTNKYVNFLPKYYETIKKYFLTETPKDFFVFTNNVDYNFLNKKDIVVVPIKHQNWPFSTLMRFNFINMVAKKLKKYSHIIYIDADMYVNLPISEKEFFAHDKPLFGVQHDSYVNKPGEFEVNPNSRAAVNRKDDLSNYWVGAFWGGQSNSILKLSKELEKRINKDLKENFIAKWHDESHLNKYFVENKHLVYTLDPSYAYPEFKPIPKPFKKKIVHTLQNFIKGNCERGGYSR